MQAVALGLITVTTAGTRVPITAALIAAAGGVLPPSGGVCRIEVWSVQANAGNALVKSSTNQIIAPIPKPASGYAAMWCVDSTDGGNTINPTSFAIDAVTSGDGAYVTVWIN